MLVVFGLMLPFFSLFAFSAEIPLSSSADPFVLIDNGVDFDLYPFNSVCRYFSTQSKNGHQYVIANPDSSGVDYVSSSIGYYANSLVFPFGSSPDFAGNYPHEQGFNVLFTYVPIELGRPFSSSVICSVSDSLGGATRTVEFSWDGSSRCVTSLYDFNHSVVDSHDFSLPNGVNTFAGFYMASRPSVSDFSYLITPIFLSNGDLQYVPFQNSDNSYNSISVSFSNSQLDANLLSFVNQGLNFYTLGFGKMLHSDGSYRYESCVSFNNKFRLYYLTMLMMAQSSDAFVTHLSNFYSSSGSSDVDLSSLSDLLSLVSSDVVAIKSALDSIYADVQISGDSVPVPDFPTPDYSAGEALDKTFNEYADYSSINSTLTSWSNQNYLAALLVYSNILTSFVDTLDFLKMLFSLVLLFIICGIVRGLPFHSLMSNDEDKSNVLYVVHSFTDFSKH